MGVSALSDIARNYEQLMDPARNETFNHLRDAYLAIRQAEEKEQDTRVAVASTMVADLIERALKDVTRAIPWDTSGVLKNTRENVISIAQRALAKLAQLGEEDVQAESILIDLGELRRMYDACIEKLNEDDRQALNVA